MLKKIGLYITLLSGFSGFAQPYISVRGDFSVDQRRGCRDLFITVTNINPGTDVILYQFEGTGSAVTANNTHTYSTTGNFWLYQYIQAGTGQKADSILIEIFDPEIVEFELESCNNNGVLVTIQNSTYDEYEINYGDGTVIQVPVNDFVPAYTYAATGTYSISVAGVYTTANNQCGTNTKTFNPVNLVQPTQLNSLIVLDNSTVVLDYTLTQNTSGSIDISVNGNSSFQTLKTLNQTSARDTITGLNLNSNYCFRITSYDACSNYKAYSNELCTANLSLNTVSEALILSWQTFYLTEFSSINIYRDNTLLQSLNTAVLTYTDSTVVCNTEYCYQLELLHSNGGISNSVNLCATAYSDRQPTGVTNVSSTINENTVSWSWSVPTNEIIGSFKILSQAGNTITNTTDTVFTQNRSEPPECLQWDFTNNCGNTSILSDLICPLELAHESNADGSTDLSWSSYNGWATGPRGYAVFHFDQDMALLDSVWVGLSTLYTDAIPDDDTQVSYYRVVAYPNDPGIANTNTNLIRVERPPIINIPSSFTPNGDGLNDTLTIHGKYISEQEISIFNRWGSVIFNSNEGQWDGTISGEKAPVGTYIYKVKIKDFTGKEHIRSGTVLILKD